jgi:hypothetical protein
VKKHETFRLHCLLQLTQARLENVVSVDRFDVGLMRHVSAEAISGRHGVLRPFYRIATLDSSDKLPRQTFANPASRSASKEVKAIVLRQAPRLVALLVQCHRSDEHSWGQALPTLAPPLGSAQLKVCHLFPFSSLLVLLQSS